MMKVVLDLKSLTIPQKVEFGRQVITSITGNSNFPTPSPALTVVGTACTDLETAYNNAEQARLLAKSKTAIQNQKEAAFNDVMNQLANYVENTSGGDEAKIKSSGMRPKAKAVKSVSVLSKPENLSATTGDKNNEIDLHWDKIAGTNSYEIEICPDPLDNTKWQHNKTVTKTKATITGLTSGLRYWFRVAAVNAKGESGWSEPVSKIVP
jgi:hypothetical protein